jgi:NTP pyrophosphatase (non-canonical NTP hydrolase)
MEGSITVAYLQRYIRSKDHNPGHEMDYFLKLIEEVGELSSMIYSGAPHARGDQIKGTIEEELWDVLYYTLALANLYGVDLERWIPVKEAINNQRYNPGVQFGEELASLPKP